MKTSKEEDITFPTACIDICYVPIKPSFITMADF